MPGAGRLDQDTGESRQGFVFPPNRSGWCFLAALFAAGCWLLAAGCWLLAPHPPPRPRTQISTRDRSSSAPNVCNVIGEGILPESYRAPLRPGQGSGVPGMVRMADHVSPATSPTQASRSENSYTPTTTTTTTTNSPTSTTTSFPHLHHLPQV